ncbi:hypothetical protein M011DRAFT_20203 [Sporormia fimetaria CBS 119925]|uniref:FHA domain-containing protein n=1 Tax=Sporormia fimetaria CBS 119925 TaxID=1340428 RepID=A0A6A6VQV2_9PLEO|nr:hypothetical protein M011DRAFT_20203 [Sporormia fimetaria CBS 119925]
MTAVAPPPNFQNISRQGWSASNGVANGTQNMANDEYRQIYMPRKSVQRSNSSSSLSSNASTSTVSASPQTNGLGPSSSGDAPTWLARKKAPRGLWPASKTEPVSAISTARPQSVASASSGPSAASAISALHTPAPMVPSQHGASQAQNGANRGQPSEGSAILHLIPMNGTFDRKTINVPFYPDVIKIGRQTNNKTIPTIGNGYFDSKVLSRQHAEVWADRSGKIWIRDVKSSNGTFVNGQRLSPENRDSDPHELGVGDMLELGIDIVSEDQKTIVHHKVAARVEHAGIYPNAGSMIDLNFGDMDSSQMQNMVGTPAQQQFASLRARNQAQGAMNAGRLQTGAPLSNMANNQAAMQQPRHPSFWLQPVHMEQVVKKLNAEIRAARQQSQDLQQTQQLIHSMLATEPKKEAVKQSPTSHVKVSPIKDIKARFSDPPAPPPQQPLPEKPDGPSLRRTDTERPIGSSSPAIAESRIATLADALNSAKKEIEAQSVRVRDLEALLNEERRAREDAEERAARLERESVKDGSSEIEKVPTTYTESSSESSQDDGANTSEQDSSANIVDVATTRLQLRLETMVAEMNEMKQQMERYRQRAEEAEADSALQRKTLAEMVEKIRHDDAERARKAARQRRSSGHDQAAPSGSLTDAVSAAEDAEDGEIPIMSEKHLDDSAGGVLQHVLKNRRSQSSTNHNVSTGRQSLVTTSSRNNLALTHGAPAASIIAVVALGVAVMTWLNAYPKVER